MVGESVDGGGVCRNDARGQKDRKMGEGKDLGVYCERTRAKRAMRTKRPYRI
jgi:hypothetical protein